MENGNTTLKFLQPDDREKVIDLFYCKDDIEIVNLNTLLDQASVIIRVTNKIGKIKVQEFQEYVHSAYMHWLANFKKFVHIKNSIHWTLGQISEIIARNNGYTLAATTLLSTQKIPLKIGSSITVILDARNTSMVEMILTA